MSNNYEAIAPYYDKLKSVVFGSTLDRASISHIDHISPDDSILIIGGGSGSVLEHIHANAIDFIDSSSKMIKLAQERKPLTDTHYHCMKFDTFPNTTIYDIVICNFFLDLFKEKELDEILLKIKQLLRPTGTLIVADFTPPQSLSHQVLETGMHWFFRWSTGLERSHFANLKQILINHGLTISSEKSFYRGFVKSWVFALEKQESNSPK